ncbi:hypothetical protein [Micromonospora sp. NPDC005710]|uniref:hypothetical protein n=1 Tax=Micromonospora sp. NPDC005710 TaxID=3157051 RepID=UPI0033E08FC7
MDENMEASVIEEGGGMLVILMALSGICIVVALVTAVRASRVVGTLLAGVGVLLLVGTFVTYSTLDDKRRTAARERLAEVAPYDAPAEMLSVTLASEPYHRTEVFGYSSVDPGKRLPRVLWDAELLAPDDPDLVVGVTWLSSCVGGVHVVESAERITVSAGWPDKGNRICVPPGVRSTFFLIDLDAPVGARQVFWRPPPERFAEDRSAELLDLG